MLSVTFSINLFLDLLFPAGDCPPKIIKTILEYRAANGEKITMDEPAAPKQDSTKKNTTAKKSLVVDMPSNNLAPTEQVKPTKAEVLAAARKLKMDAYIPLNELKKKVENWKRFDNPRFKELVEAAETVIRSREEIEKNAPKENKDELPSENAAKWSKADIDSENDSEYAAYLDALKRGGRVDVSKPFKVEDVANERPYLKMNQAADGAFIDSGATRGNHFPASGVVAARQSLDSLASIIANRPQRAQSVFGSLKTALENIENGKPVFTGGRNLTAKNFVTSMQALGFDRKEGAKSAYFVVNNELATRTSDHSANAELFVQDSTDNNLSIVIRRSGDKKRFNADDSVNVVEAVYTRADLDAHPEKLPYIVRDIAEFIATGEYHDTAGAMAYNYSGSEAYKAAARNRIYADALARGDVKKVREMALDAIFKNIKPTTHVEARWIQPVNGVEDEEKFNSLVNDFKKNGWRGRPIIAWNDDGEHWIAFTGSHRIAAAKKAGIKVPVYEIPNDAIQEGYEALEEVGESGDDLIYPRDDYDMASVFQRMVNEFDIEEFSIPAKILNMESSIDDSVTYDDAGNVIPLSERFNMGKKDIRWSKNSIISEDENNITLRPLQTITDGKKVMQGRAISFKQGSNYNPSRIKAAFDKLNSDKDSAELATRVFDVAERLGVSLHFGSAGNTPTGVQADGYYTAKNITLDSEFFASPLATDAEKADVILHELIHSVTSYAIDTENGEPINRKLYLAVQDLRNVYEQSKDKITNEEEASNDIHEFVANLASPEFRGKLKNIGVWERVVNSIQNIINALFNTNLGDYKLSNADLAARNALGRILDNYDKSAFDAISGNNNSTSARWSISNLYTGSAADYANKNENGNIINPPSLHYVGTGEGSQVYGYRSHTLQARRSF